MAITKNVRYPNVRAAVTQQSQGSIEMEILVASRTANAGHQPEKPKATHFEVNRPYTLTPLASLDNDGPALTNDNKSTSTSVESPQPATDAEDITQKIQRLMDELKQQIIERDKQIASFKQQQQQLVDEQKWQLANRDKEIASLKEEFTKERDLREAQAEHEEITRSLFQEANRIVAREHQKLLEAVETT